MNVVIIQYNAGNICSVQFALRRCGVEAVITNDATTIRAADKVIFPGVGAAGAAMAHLTETGLNELIPALRQPVLGICVGMQLFCQSSEENDTTGMSILQQKASKFTGPVKVPKMGWSPVVGLKTSLFRNIAEQSFMYFVHSYYVPECQETIATAGYAGSYSAAIKKDNFYGVQFHPEKSGPAGQQLLQNFLEI